MEIANKNSNDKDPFDENNIDYKKLPDFILAYNVKKNQCKKRATFEKNLENENLEVVRKEIHNNMQYIAIYAPDDVLKREAKLLNLQLPISNQKIKDAVEKLEDEEQKQLVMETLELTPLKREPVEEQQKLVKETLEPTTLKPKPVEIKFEYNEKNQYLFKDPIMFDFNARTSIVHNILQNTKYNDENSEYGVKNMLTQKVYDDAYPLHDESLSDITKSESKRKYLWEEWANLRMWNKEQPLDDVKDYFGAKFGIYFAWLGFYNKMLIYAAVAGVICTFLGIFTAKYSILSEEICHSNITMCPRCDGCEYWNLNDTCISSKLHYVIDNVFTVTFSIFMSFWATFYLVWWEKRIIPDITFKWDLLDFDSLADPPRVEYLTQIENLKNAKNKINMKTGQKEKKVSFSTTKLPRYFISFSISLIFITVVTGFTFGIVLYRMAAISSKHFSKNYTVYTTSVLASVLNLIAISLMDLVYNYSARYLTDIEYHRTQNEYDNSLSAKIYLFQFVNYYSSVFYIAFLKGKFTGSPAKLTTVFGLRQEECNHGGCLVELSIQLSIIMIGKQILGTLTEMTGPLMSKQFKFYKNLINEKTMSKKSNPETTEPDSSPTKDCPGSKQQPCLPSENSIDQPGEKNELSRWAQDYELENCESDVLIYEYIEMIIQYGFVTMFVAAFPLAPLFALINNVLEVRLDAYKFLKHYRRPIPIRVKNIGIWLKVMYILGRLSALSNAFIIAFTSNFIPKIVYYYQYSTSNFNDKKNYTMHGFLEHSLAIFNVSNFPKSDNKSIINANLNNITTCRYLAYRDENHRKGELYWHIMTARISFILAYTAIVSFGNLAMQYALSRSSSKLKDKITSKNIIKRELYKQYTSKSKENLHLM